MSKQTDRLKRRLDAIPRAVKAAVAPALITSGRDLCVTMRLLAPVDSGDLRDSIHITLPGETTPPYSQPGGSTTAGENQVLITVGNSDVRYPHIVEFGSADTAAQPFFWPAFRLKKKSIANRIKRAIRKAVKEAT
ncbi:HK97-gp10 family putative phage morphogenesis protein [Agrobacterium rosae]|uniref:Phage protein, HK97 gp10 family n=1 Tax=Agrobacterium rosae TaxID=1972867 RepID=A0A1R3TUT4_9HYPH|nr:HK97-gp10 family putative phage morphogenesis protein [Agrobacterium rosae]SCX27185.1 phage protein, HK97 gp10 family [Agrobacterium rosae]